MRNKDFSLDDINDNSKYTTSFVEDVKLDEEDFEQAKKSGLFNHLSIDEEESK